MKLPFAPGAGSSAFRLRWRGYDRAQVDELLGQTAADQRQLQESLAHLDALVPSYGQDGPNATIAAARREADEIRTRAQEEAQRVVRQAADGADLLQRERLQTSRRELERLTSLRLEVAGCLEASVVALRRATDLLPANTETKTNEVLRAPDVAAPAADTVTFSSSGQTGMPRHRALAFLAPASAAVAVLALLTYQFVTRETPAAASPDSHEGTTANVEEPIEPAPIETAREGIDSNTSGPPRAVVGQTDGLVLTLTARRACWIGTMLDGGQDMERLLKPDETIILYAHDEAVLRLGDAGALSVLINNQPTKSLGADGQVATRRITRANYGSFLAGSSPQSLSHATVPRSDAVRFASAFSS